MKLENLLRKGKNGIAAGLFGLTAIGAGGCATYINEKGKTVLGFWFEKPAQSGNFFVCNYWQDKNQDGMVSNEEYLGIKDQFRSNEWVTFIGEINGKQGANLSIKVWNGEGRLIRNETSIVAFGNYVQKVEYEPWQLYNLGGAGRYTVSWYLNDNLISTKNFNLIH